MIICLLLLSVFLVHSSIICWQVSCGLWEIARLLLVLVVLYGLECFLGFILHLGARMGRDGSGYRYGFLARAFRHSMLFIYASEISDLTGYFFRGSKVSCRAGPYLIGMGVPMGLQFSITAIGSIMLQSANNALGTACVAAFTSAARIKMFFICAFESLGIAMATYCGQNYGAGKPERILQGIKVSSLMMLTYAAATWMILMLGSRCWPCCLWLHLRSDTGLYGAVFAYFLLVLPGCRATVYLALRDTRGRF